MMVHTTQSETGLFGTDNFVTSSFRHRPFFLPDHVLYYSSMQFYFLYINLFF